MTGALILVAKLSSDNTGSSVLLIIHPEDICTESNKKDGFFQGVLPLQTFLRRTYPSPQNTGPYI